MKILDLFCGAGGFSFGFKTDSNSDQLGVDTDPSAASTFTMNYPNATLLQVDIGRMHSSTIVGELGGYPDIIIASPPCEEFSKANPESDRPAAERIYGDGSARLLLDTIRLIGDLSPKVFIVENVAALLHSGGRGIVKAEFERVGIEDVHFNMVHAHHHGNPSKRLRVFISNRKYVLRRKRAPHVMEAIGDLPPLGLGALLEDHDNVPNHEIHPLTEEKMKLIRKTQWGQGAKHFRGSKERVLPNWVRLFPDQVATSIIGLGRYIHPIEDRLLTVREHARLMSYPDNFIFTGPIDSQYDQVGESVPPLISELIAKEALTQIE
ncbi:MAG: DNA cytosine methyltransferase [Candidatus Thorarchaeota archaeon]|nr:MAG: DNA cytosine methyltransferase [Candidatus Thorarchaeota archaeon]